MAAKRKKKDEEAPSIEAALLETAEKTEAPPEERVPCVTCGASVLPGVPCPTDGQVA